jgi:hypothetical protein
MKNPPVHPCEQQIRLGGKIIDTIPVEGMTLLDHFAGQALAGLNARPDQRNYSRPNRQTFEEWQADALMADARTCYKLAGIMLAAREEFLKNHPEINA